MREAQYDICEIQISQESWILIRDVGPWDKYPTVTNDAEGVVERLITSGYLPDGRKLYYYDSEGVMDEILVINGKFAGFQKLETAPHLFGHK